eukprot:tig00000448_g863.t1
MFLFRSASHGETGKQLVIIRHAQSSWELPPGTQDIDRPLTSKGVGDAHSTGLQLLNRGWVPDRVLVSPAVRTEMTWQYVHEAFSSIEIATEYVEDLYVGSEKSLLSSARAHAGDAKRLAVVSHWPGVKESTDFLARSNVEMGTAHAALLRYKGNAGDSWDEALQKEGGWKLVDVLAPFRDQGGAPAASAGAADPHWVNEACVEALDEGL